MKMKAIIITAILTSQSMYAQEVVSTQGESYSNGTANIDFTIGEVVIDSGTDGTYDITQGFHQTNWNFVGLEDHFPVFEATVYPNPMSDILNIKVSAFEHVQYTLYDGQGKLVLQDVLSSEQTSFQVNDLAPGSYSLVLQNDSQLLKTFKLVKTF